MEDSCYLNAKMRLTIIRGSKTMGKPGRLEKTYMPQVFEEDVMKLWDTEEIYEEIRAKSIGKPKFYFLDGPPYPSSGVPHIGTAWNKVLKDAIIRYKRMKGFWVWDKPGYDTHGLPIEVAVEKNLRLKTKKDIVEKVGISSFIDECRKLALCNATEMSANFKDLGVSLDWKNPYYTLTSSYIESAWWLIKRAWEKGLLSRGLKVVWWCPRCETVLSDYEVTEYRELSDPSIYVMFPVKGRPGEYLLVWTTTPWTLPANVALMVHPDLTYVEVDVGGKKVILLKERVGAVISRAVEEYRILREFPGRALLGIEYIPPLLEEVPLQGKLKNSHKVVLSDKYVKPTEGTGIVHMAPGHGEEDYEVAKEYGLPIICPVDERGEFTVEAGKYNGLSVREANKIIIGDLKKKNLLFYSETIVHRYPVCWRCKTPLVLRATVQWYIRVSNLKERFIEEAEKVEWIPQWALMRFKNWLKELRDWVVSRQRYWGIPLPIWECSKCGNIAVIGSLKELERLVGAPINLRDLHRPWVDQITFKCSKCGNSMKRVEDVLDVWFDSGVAFYASLGYPMNKDLFEKLEPVDFITEGHDQIAGWFFSLLRAGIIGFNRAPYKCVLMHGYMLDEHGREMHKSLGNYVAPTEVVEKYGRDTLRFWLLQNTIWEDARFNWRSIEQVFRDLHILWNVYVFASTYMNIDGYDPLKHGLEDVEENIQPEDRWILSRLNRLIRESSECMEKYHVHEATRMLREFIVEDVSHWYIRLIRRRIWVEGEDPLKDSAYATLYEVLKKYLILLAPIAPFITEKLYQEMIRPAEPNLPKSIHMLEWPDVEEKWINERLENLMNIIREIVELSASARMRRKIKMRQPLPVVYLLTDEDDVKEAASVFKRILMEQVNVKNVSVMGRAELSRFRVKRAKPRISVIGPELRGLAPQVIAFINENSREIAEKIEREGEVEVMLQSGERIVISEKHVEITEEDVEHYVVQEAPWGYVILDVRFDWRARAEGLARDIVRRVQYMRKEMDLPVEAYIKLHVVCPDSESRKMLEEFKDYICEETRTREFSISVGDYGKRYGDYCKDWDIDGKIFEITVLVE